MNKIILMLANYPTGLKKAWGQNGYRVVEDNNCIIDLDKRLIENKLTEWKSREKISHVFSINFSPIVAEYCFEYDIIYVSWIVDSPHVSLLSNTIRYSTNRVFVFDYAQWEELYAKGYDNIYYLPLATDVDLLQNTLSQCTREQKSKYLTDVSFMGNLYDKPPHNAYDQIQYMPPYIKGYLESLMKVQRMIWGKNLVHTAIVDNVWDEIRKNIHLDLEAGYDEGVYELFIESILYKKITQLERKEVCSYLARNFNFYLYSGSDTSYDKQIVNRGYVDYVREMPLVFRFSKININITLHGISTGIPLRVLDILACGGFCLTNYQEEIALYFEDGVDLVIYSDFEDMYEKIKYYLSHEEERKAIAQAGYEKVRTQFDYRNGIAKIVGVLNEVN